MDLDQLCFLVLQFRVAENYWIIVLVLDLKYLCFRIVHDYCKI